MGRPRSAARKNWPEGLYQNAAGYFWWKDPASGKGFGLGTERAGAMAEARAANAKRAGEQSSTLVERISTSDCPSLSDWVDSWIQTVTEEKKALKTIKNHRSSLRELVNRCGKIAVRDIKPRMIAEVLEWYIGRGHQRMAGLVRSTAFELFRVAEVAGHISAGANPVTATEVKTAKVKRTRLTLETYLEIHAGEKRPWAKRALELALVTMQRRQDIAKMVREDIVDGHLHVDQGKGKGKTRLAIPLTLSLDAVGWSLKEVIDRCRVPGVRSPYLVHHHNKGGVHVPGDPVGLDTLSEILSEGVADVGLVIEEGRTPPTLHEIRSLGIRLFSQQYGKEFAQTLAGHKNMKTTLLYADLRDPTIQRIMVPDPRAPVSNE